MNDLQIFDLMKDEISFIPGSIVRFGRYPQNSDIPEPILWTVLGFRDTKALLITKSILDCRPYHQLEENSMWCNCTLRAWLNNDFLRHAFSDDEKKRIAEVRVENPANWHYHTGGGDPTRDKVFCLSEEEAEKYFGEDKDRKANPTAFAQKNGAYVNDLTGRGQWWLRSPGITNEFAAAVMESGGIDPMGDPVDLRENGIRPAIFVSL